MAKAKDPFAKNFMSAVKKVATAQGKSVDEYMGGKSGREKPSAGFRSATPGSHFDRSEKVNPFSTGKRKSAADFPIGSKVVDKEGNEHTVAGHHPAGNHVEIGGGKFKHVSDLSSLASSKDEPPTVYKEKPSPGFKIPPPPDKAEDKTTPGHHASVIGGGPKKYDPKKPDEFTGSVTSKRYEGHDIKEHLPVGTKVKDSLGREHEVTGHVDNEHLTTDTGHTLHWSGITEAKAKVEEKSAEPKHPDGQRAEAAGRKGTTQTGPRGGTFYTTASGQKIYLGKKG